MSYPLVHISNSTPYAVAGKVSYASAFCSDDDYTINPSPGTWTAKSRGVCLVTEISAKLLVNGSWVNASSYTSSGTSYSQFAIIQTGNTYAVTRVVSAVNAIDSDTGELLAEPTTNQK
jgi:hypothetical protein